MGCGMCCASNEKSTIVMGTGMGDTDLNELRKASDRKASALKNIRKIFLCFAFLVSLEAAVPTPDSAMTFFVNKDPRKWTPQHQSANKNGFIMEFVPEGDSIKTWKEMA